MERHTVDRLSASRRVHALVLWLLLTAFLVRVFGQLLQAWREVPWLPPFDAWHSATVPYPALVAGQAAVILVCLRAIWRLTTGRTQPSRPTGRALLVLGALYFALMVARLVLGFSLLSQVNWFDAPLASVFHLVLAAFVLTLARFHLRHAAR